MLPDLTKIKSRANRDLLRWVRQQVPAVTPLIQGVATFRQHEGKVGKIIRMTVLRRRSTVTSPGSSLRSVGMRCDSLTFKRFSKSCWTLRSE